jgi:hypothetical protein
MEEDRIGKQGKVHEECKVGGERIRGEKKETRKKKTNKK